MKVLILAGGLGTRLSEDTINKPKPMVEIGGKPILWHIMKIYSHHGFNEFVILLGYKGNIIKEYFSNYFLNNSDITFDLKNNEIEIKNNNCEPWKVTLVDTGYSTMTGGRIKRAQTIIGNEPFMLTYGDGVANINLKDLVDFHKSHNGKITMTSIQPEGRFGALDVDENFKVNRFTEKPRGDGNWINGGYFVCEPDVFNYITEGDDSVFEQTPLEDLALKNLLYTYKHYGFWMPMDTLKDRTILNNMWLQNVAPWKLWE
ncbi:glucose-1-phosphate cytidylyltransferase [bacterium]|nr:glucose-1-phosphate cytidylyltransferase [bacterium]